MTKKTPFGNSIKFPMKGEFTPEEIFDELLKAVEKLDPAQKYKHLTLFVTPVDQSTIKQNRTIQIQGPHRTAAADHGC